jgi:hypothetical protein
VKALWPIVGRSTLAHCVRVPTCVSAVTVTRGLLRWLLHSRQQLAVSITRQQWRAGCLCLAGGKESGKAWLMCHMREAKRPP